MKNESRTIWTIMLAVTALFAVGIAAAWPADVPASTVSTREINSAAKGMMSSAMMGTEMMSSGMTDGDMSAMHACITDENMNSMHEEMMKSVKDPAVRAQMQEMHESMHKNGGQCPMMDMMTEKTSK